MPARYTRILAKLRPCLCGFCYHAPGVAGAEGGIEVGEALDKLLASGMVVEREEASSGDTMLGLAHLVEKAEVGLLLLMCARTAPPTTTRRPFEHRHGRSLS